MRTSYTTIQWLPEKKSPVKHCNSKLIRKFIQENLPHISDTDDIPEEFEAFWAREQQEAFHKISTEEKLDPLKLQAVLGNYLFTERKPLRDEVMDMLEVKPKILERKAIYERVVEKVVGYVDTFVSGMGLHII